ncbi:hypothetical protein [Ahniella affigens]|uniref:hypothetical protein n=1 Tax=Ahniella affigens TaxID=2021234 RepID=UPI0011B1F158|nr:hypothetical protein [Ahniella affigens]
MKRVESGREAAQDGFELGSSLTQFRYLRFGIGTLADYFQGHINATDLDEYIVMHRDWVKSKVSGSMVHQGILSTRSNCEVDQAGCVPWITFSVAGRESLPVNKSNSRLAH